mmetsp:Transcript_11409/g.22796  ORF Transcript_11409/g.22796 Transcript_11409/m.22796 type:complete len:245 (-) Transcript_11409:23-757(-)
MVPRLCLALYNNSLCPLLHFRLVMTLQVRISWFIFVLIMRISTINTSRSMMVQPFRINKEKLDNIRMIGSSSPTPRLLYTRHKILPLLQRHKSRPFSLLIICRHKHTPPLRLRCSLQNIHPISLWILQHHVCLFKIRPPIYSVFASLLLSQVVDCLDRFDLNSVYSFQNTLNFSLCCLRHSLKHQFLHKASRVVRCSLSFTERKKFQWQIWQKGRNPSPKAHISPQFKVQENRTMNDITRLYTR